MAAHIGPRIDTLPEGARYEDTGCKFSPKCVDCPLPQCRYEVQAGFGWIRDPQAHFDRDVKIVELRKKGVPVPELARQFKISSRSVHRVLQHGGPSPALRQLVEDIYGPDRPGKPVSEIRSPFRQRAPLPRLPVGGRA